MNKEIVVSVTFKELDWLDQLKDIKKTIYRKGTPLKNENEIKIEPNKGVAEHTYFYHIYHNYYNLSDITFFVQDYPFDHWSNPIEVINNNSWKEINDIKISDGYYGFHINASWKLDKSEHFNDANVFSCLSNGNPHHSFPQDHTIDIYWEKLFLSPKPDKYEFVPGTHFALTKEHAKIRSRNFYKQVMDLLLVHDITPHVIERLNSYIFDERFIARI